MNRIPSTAVARPSARGGRRMLGIGAVLAVGSLSACSSGWAGPSVHAGATPAAGSTVAGTDGSPSPAPVAGTSSVAPAPSVAAPSVATDGPPSRTTDVVLSFVGWDAKAAQLEAGGYLSPVVETGGTCTLELTRGTLRVSVSAPAQPDASTTSCGNLVVPRSKLVPGTWSAVLRYASPATKGSSDPSPVEVPQ